MIGGCELKRTVLAILTMFLMLAVTGVLGYIIGDTVRYQVRLVFKPSLECSGKAYVLFR